MSKRKEELAFYQDNSKCTLNVVEVTDDVGKYYYIRVHARSHDCLLFAGLSYTDLLLALLHGKFMFELITELVNALYRADKRYTLQLELIKNEIGSRYIVEIEKYILDCGRRGLPVPFRNWSDKYLRVRRTFWENRKARHDGSHLPRETDFLWSKFSQLPALAGGE